MCFQEKKNKPHFVAVAKSEAYLCFCGPVYRFLCFEQQFKATEALTQKVFGRGHNKDLYPEPSVINACKQEQKLSDSVAQWLQYEPRSHYFFPFA